MSLVMVTAVDQASHGRLFNTGSILRPWTPADLPGRLSRCGRVPSSGVRGREGSPWRLVRLDWVADMNELDRLGTHPLTQALSSPSHVSGVAPSAARPSCRTQARRQR